ncbi:SphA family protein [Anaeromyxobacter terrae]|uniref:SphA family protein n=1 Tax=Anaeromyxobacter terrae TaxID=2925406 RepID=UPI001F5A0E1D|nr:transporter [Anaeromyxobacter sp. SG22]
MSALRLQVVALLALLPPLAEAQLNVGHKTLGAVGLDAGSQPEPGLYVVERALLYDADEARDRHGDRIPIGMDLDAFGNGIGVIGVVEVRPLSTYLTAAIAIPIAHVTVTTDRPEASTDRLGLGDVYVQPLKLGWRWPRSDLGIGYGFYAPTGRFEPGGRDGVGRGHWTHQLSAGGTAYLDPARTWNVSAVASYDHNQRKQGIDLTRGDTVQLQGGAGKTLLRFLQLGVAGYALWQVRDDRGADLPPVLRGARDRIFGLGPEVGVLVAPLRSKLTIRYERELGARSRPQGQLLVLGLTFVALGGERPADRTP